MDAVDGEDEKTASAEQNVWTSTRAGPQSRWTMSIDCTRSDMQIDLDFTTSKRLCDFSGPGGWPLAKCPQCPPETPGPPAPGAKIDSRFERFSLGRARIWRGSEVEAPSSGRSRSVARGSKGPGWICPPRYPNTHRNLQMFLGELVFYPLQTPAW